MKDLVAAARIEADPETREDKYIEPPEDGATRTSPFDRPLPEPLRQRFPQARCEDFYQNPLGRLFLEDTVKN